MAPRIFGIFFLLGRCCGFRPRAAIQSVRMSAVVLLERFTSKSQTSALRIVCWPQPSTAIKPVTRSTRALLLMLAMLWQALFWVTPIGQSKQIQDVENLVAHSQAVDHHHHDDQSLHVDDSAESQFHHHAHEAVEPAALLPVVVEGPFFTPPGAPPTALLALWASAFLQGPLRPPQPHA